ncbi:diguanylate cyclase (GGDEF)-like protein [Blastococcus colisei]|uniref:Diguanylate cyclase (GGDEF)-like protein n=1 Tax=Blastococcus colisei TaxID=1564162 RepID=A0A543PJJ0_9ACTN|nr:EAL domain-containing protein [Blastococcus colisei]TQN44219.1 diguanylate cyclase (GGDEF)-like protein [Blastococcus colisei]
MTSQPTAVPASRERRTADSAGRRLRLSAHTASAGLVAVLLVLTVFSVGAAITNAAAATEAELSVEVSELADAAEQSLAMQEELVDDLVVEDDAGTRAAYQAAAGATREALRGIGTAHGEDLQQLERWLGLQARYEATVAELLDVARTDPTVAEEFEEEHVEVHFDAVEEVVQAEVWEHRSAADEALADLRGAHQVLLWVTPAVFGVGLALVAWCTTVLHRSRRETAARAEENRQQALHDALTGLPNRTLLRQRAAAALDAAAAGPGTVALMLIDLDRFKEINDTLGHAYGDVVLQVVGERLLGAVRATDTVARLGGDEFAILLPNVHGADAALELAARAQAAMEAPIEAEGATLDVDASIGIALSGVDGGDVESLLRNADIAMYSAKDRGVGVCVFDTGLDDHSPERLGLLGELRRAIDSGELVLHYQPKMAMVSEEVCGVEALVRWQHPERGIIPPALFIPLAERTPLIHPLTRYVIDTALAQCARWQAEGRTLQVAVNVSARNLLDDGFVDDVLELLVRRGVPAACLELEVTESAIMADPARAQQILGRLADAGITLSIDDFGAGYTSLAHLKDLPIHQLKIDRSFVASMTTDRSDALIVRAVVELGHNLGLTTVAEGVEDEATWQRLRAAGCDLAQGYHLARPMPASELEGWYDATRGVLRS